MGTGTRTSTRTGMGMGIGTRARHDAMMRMLIKEFTKGSKGSHYLIADVGTVDTLKDLGVHSKRVPKFVLPDSHIQHTTQNTEPCNINNHSTCRIGEARKRMRPDMMIVELTDTEQHTYLPHDTDTGQAPWTQTAKLAAHHA